MYSSSLITFALETGWAYNTATDSLDSTLGLVFALVLLALEWLKVLGLVLSMAEWMEVLWLVSGERNSLYTEPSVSVVCVLLFAGAEAIPFTRSA